MFVFQREHVILSKCDCSFCTSKIHGRNQKGQVNACTLGSIALTAPRLRATYQAQAAGAAPVSYALGHDGNGTESRRPPDGGKSPEGSSYAAGCLLLLWVGSVGETGPQNLPSRWARTAVPVRNLRPRCQHACCAGGSPGGPCPSVHGCPAPLTAPGGKPPCQEAVGCLFSVCGLRAHPCGRCCGFPWSFSPQRCHR